MDPFSLMGITAISLIGQGFGALKSMDAAKEYNQAQQAQIQAEMAQDKVRRQQMEIDYHRQSLQNLRHVMQTMAVGTANAVGQGVSLDDSSVQAGRSQAKSQGGYNQEGLNANLLFGRQMFDLNSQINQAKIAAANAQMGMQEGSAISSFFGNVGSAFKGFGK